MKVMFLERYSDRVGLGSNPPVEDQYVSSRRARAGIVLAATAFAASLATAGLFAAVVSYLDGLHWQEPNPVEKAAAATVSTTVTADGATQPGINEPSYGAVASAARKTITPRNPGSNLNIGDCVEFGASPAEIQKTACGAGNSGYRVFDLAADGGQCPRDADRTQVRARPGGSSDTLCLDIDWVVGDCMDLSTGVAKPVDCAVTPGRVRVVEIKGDTADVNTCSVGDRGFVYGQRRFVVCVSSR